MAINKKCLWYLTLSYDILFFISSFLFVSFNSYILYKLTTYKPLIGIKPIAPVILHVVVGIFYIVLSWCGWKVAYKVHSIHLKLYSVLLILMTLLQFGCIIWIIYILSNTMKNEVTKNTDIQFNLAIAEDENAKLLWDRIQTQMQCCGVGGPTDYRKSNSVPWACCKRTASEISGDCNSVHQHGCLLNIYDETYHKLVFAILSSVGMILIQILGIVAYFSLGKAVQNMDSSITSSRPNQPSAPLQLDVSENLINHSSTSKY